MAAASSSAAAQDRLRPPQTGNRRDDSGHLRRESKRPVLVVRGVAAEAVTWVASSDRETASVVSAMPHQIPELRSTA